MAEIRLSGINKVYPGGTHAVHDVDLHIADGEFMIMVGPSGCAKSTILRMIAGLETPTSGALEIGGRLVNDVAPKDRDIAMVFQSYALYPHMTVRENMAFGLRLRRMPQGEIDQRVSEAARILGLEQLLDRLPKAMSGGQRQRVAMGRAIVREPQAFLMDEPLSNLDAKLRVQMRTEIAKLHQRLETTTVYVTHDQVEAMTLGQRICILRKGVVQQVDTPFQVYQNPANVFVGGFIGSPGMNFMNGHLKLHDGVLYLQLGDQHLPVPASVTSRLVATTDLHGRGVIVGIRPEHLAMSTPGDAGAIPVQVELTEAMGAEVYAYFTANVGSPDLTALSDTQATAANYIARLGSGTDVRVGEQIMLRPDMDELHLFDAQSLLTLLAPANEAEVRARQSGAAIQLASGTAASMGSPVAAPASTLVQPVQPVIHLHQTIVQPEQPMYGTLGEHAASPAAIASVFDQPVAAPIHVEPLVVGAPAVASVEQRPAFAARPAMPGVTTPGMAMPGMAAPGMAAPGSATPGLAAPTSGPYASLASSSAHAPAATGGTFAPATPAASPTHDVAALGAGTPEPVAGTPIADVPAVDESVAVDAVVAEPPVEPAQPAAPARRGFAPRVIGATPAGTPLTPAPVAATTAPSNSVAGDDTATVRLDDADLDAALDAIESVDEHRVAPIEGATSEATVVVVDETLGEPVTVPFPRAGAHEGAQAPVTSGFRAALERIRSEHAPVGAPRLSGSVLPPPMSLAPAPVESLADTMGAAPAAPSADAAVDATLPSEPVVVHPPQLPGIVPPNQG